MSMTAGTSTGSKVADTIANLMSREGAGLYGLCGPAGTGKTFTSGRLREALGLSVYSIDQRFIGDSASRKDLLKRKQRTSIQAFLDSANQFNWWDWGLVLQDVDLLSSGQPAVIRKAYDRDKGATGEDVVVPPTRQVIIEGAFLGPPFVIRSLQRIFFIRTPQWLRFQRLHEKDRTRRTMTEICARFLITEYSETQYYHQLFNWAADKIVFLDGESGLPVGRPTLEPEQFLPIDMAL